MSTENNGQILPSKNQAILNPANSIKVGYGCSRLSFDERTAQDQISLEAGEEKY
jgi:hypothetical protein